MLFREMKFSLLKICCSLGNTNFQKKEEFLMLYFRFNTDNFIAPQQECTVTKFAKGKPVGSSRKEIETVTLGDIENWFFKKLMDELQLSGVELDFAFYDVINIPVDAFGIDDEVIGNFDGVLKYALSEYAKLPIEELDNKSLNDVGIYIEFCKRVLNEEIESKLNKYMQENNLEYVTEEVLWKNMTNDQKANKFSQYLLEIGSEGNELIVVDPYLFNSTEDEYCEILAAVLAFSKAETIIVVTDEKNCKKTSVDKVSNRINKTVKITYSKDFHDRFWIADRKKGFYTGTSFNGIGKKISLINMLSQGEVFDIIDELCKQSLIV